MLRVKAGWAARLSMQSELGQQEVICLLSRIALNTRGACAQAPTRVHAQGLAFASMRSSPSRVRTSDFTGVKLSIRWEKPVLVVN